MAKGDHIYIKQGSITHHGIDCGDGTVIHYRGKQAGGRIIQTSYRNFKKGQYVYVKSYSYKFSANTIVRRARKRLYERNYNLFFNNCEHFATYCTTGKSYSQQVDDVKNAGATTLAAGAGLLAVETTVPAAGLLGAVGFTTTVGLPVAAVLGGAALAGGAAFGVLKKLSESNDRRR